MQRIQRILISGVVAGLVVIPVAEAGCGRGADHEGASRRDRAGGAAPPRARHRPRPRRRVAASRPAGARRASHAPRSGKLLFVDGFESGKLDRWIFRWLRRRESARIVSAPVRFGKHALEMSLRRSDPMFSKGKRSELQVPGHYDLGKAYWYGFSVRVPRGWKEDYKAEVVAQWFATRDKDLGERPRSPSLALRILKRSWVVTYRYDRKRLSVGNTAPKGKVYKAPYRRGVWTDWVFHVRWSAGDDGLTQVWKNGTLVATRKGPNTYNDRVGPILKLGIYKAPWNKPEARSAVSERLLYFDEVRVGTAAARYEDVAPPRR